MDTGDRKCAVGLQNTKKSLVYIKHRESCHKHCKICWRAITTLITHYIYRKHHHGHHNDVVQNTLKAELLSRGSTFYGINE